MSNVDVTLKEAEAAVARETFQATLQQLQQRLSPRSIVGDVKDKALAKANGALNAAREGVVQAATHPSAVAAISVPLLLYFFRKPIAGALQSWRGTDEDTADPAPKPASRRRKSAKSPASQGT